MMRTLSRKIAGHAWTIAPTLRHRIAPRRAPDSEPWTAILDDPHNGPVRLHGKLSEPADATALTIVIHGLGGHADSAYLVDIARAADRAGHACLRLGLRGSACSGEDIYHAGLTDDLRAALADDALADYERVHVVGFSLGGHITLRAAIDGMDEKVASVAAICPPLDLAAGQRAIDAPRRKIYREYILRELRAMYREVAARGRAPTPLERIEQVRTLREWDALTVVRRFGFHDVDDYYESMSVADDLGDLAVDALIVASKWDPMIPAETLHPALDRAGDRLESRLIDSGGHVFFPADTDLGLSDSDDAFDQIIGWLQRR